MPPQPTPHAQAANLTHGDLMRTGGEPHWNAGHASAGSRVLISGQIRQPVQAGEASTSWARTSMAHVPALTASARVLLLLLACAAKMLRKKGSRHRSPPPCPPPHPGSAVRP